jgi:hypothetical protein
MRRQPKVARDNRTGVQLKKKNFYVKSPERDIKNGEKSDEAAEGEKRV